MRGEETYRKRPREVWQARLTAVSSHFESGLARETRNSYGNLNKKVNSSDRGSRKVGTPYDATPV